MKIAISPTGLTPILLGLLLLACSKPVKETEAPVMEETASKADPCTGNPWSMIIRYMSSMRWRMRSGYLREADGIAFNR